MVTTKNITNTEKLLGTDKAIVFMGPTGAGMSHFIDTLTGQPCQRASPCSESYTSKVRADRLCNHPTYGNRLVLVDTPGFDSSTGKSDEEIRQVIGEWLRKVCDKDFKLAGMIYMHRITDKRMAESPLRMFSKLCGDQAVEKVVLVTTMWYKQYTEEKRKREKEIIGEYERTMKNHSVSTARFSNSLESAQEIINSILGQPGAEVLPKQPPPTSPLDLYPIPPPTPEVSVPLNTQLPGPSQPQADHDVATTTSTVEAKPTHQSKPLALSPSQTNSKVVIKAVSQLPSNSQPESKERLARPVARPTEPEERQAQANNRTHATTQSARLASSPSQTNSKAVTEAVNQLPSDSHLGSKDRPRPGPIEPEEKQAQTNNRANATTQYARLASSASQTNSKVVTEVVSRLPPDSHLESQDRPRPGPIGPKERQSQANNHTNATTQHTPLPSSQIASAPQVTPRPSFFQQLCCLKAQL